jgi:hypothetical protein
MKILHAKREPDRFFDAVTEPLVDTVTDSLGAVRDAQRSTLVKAAVITGGLAALTAGSAAISSLRRRRGEIL